MVCKQVSVPREDTLNADPLTVEKLEDNVLAGQRAYMRRGERPLKRLAQAETVEEDKNRQDD
jgi:hypothetical protein